MLRSGNSLTAHGSVWNLFWANERYTNSNIFLRDHDLFHFPSVGTVDCSFYVGLNQKIHSCCRHGYILYQNHFSNIRKDFFIISLFTTHCCEVLIIHLSLTDNLKNRVKSWKFLPSRGKESHIPVMDCSIMRSNFQLLLK